MGNCIKPDKGDCHTPRPLEPEPRRRSVLVTALETLRPKLLGLAAQLALKVQKIEAAPASSSIGKWASRNGACGLAIGMMERNERFKVSLPVAFCLHHAMGCSSRVVMSECGGRSRMRETTSTASRMLCSG